MPTTTPDRQHPDLVNFRRAGDSWAGAVMRRLARPGDDALEYSREIVALRVDDPRFGPESMVPPDAPGVGPTLRDRQVAVLFDGRKPTVALARALAAWREGVADRLAREQDAHRLIWAERGVDLRVLTR